MPRAQNGGRGAGRGKWPFGPRKAAPKAAFQRKPPRAKGPAKKWSKGGGGWAKRKPLIPAKRKPLIPAKRKPLIPAKRKPLIPAKRKPVVSTKRMDSARRKPAANTRKNNSAKRKKPSGGDGEPVFFWLEKPQPNDPWRAHTFSNWYPSTFVVNGTTYNCVEQFMMVAKASLFMAADPATNQGIVNQLMRTSDPKAIKALGRKVVGLDATLWDRAGRKAVFVGALQKFAQNPSLRALLLNTGSRLLVEASPFDKIWGIGLTADQARITPRAQWPGENRLGEVLMQVRRVLATHG